MSLRLDFSSYYTENAAVVETLETIDPSAYQKYIDWMARLPKTARLLDVGCGTGIVANQLSKLGYDAHGIDANKLAISKAATGPATFHLATDYRLPFGDATFDGVGSYTVVEHIGDPELFFSEQVRVLKPGGQMIVGCPNFLQVVGLASHHWRTRGFVRKGINAALLLRKALRYHVLQTYAFDMMEPIVRERFEPDDDAIVVTNAIDICAALRKRGMKVGYASGTDRYFPPLLENLGCAPFLRSLIGAVFVVADKTA